MTADNIHLCYCLFTTILINRCYNITKRKTQIKTSPASENSRAFSAFLNAQPSTLLTILGLGDLSPASIFCKKSNAIIQRKIAFMRIKALLAIIITKGLQLYFYAFFLSKERLTENKSDEGLGVSQTTITYKKRQKLEELEKIKNCWK